MGLKASEKQSKFCVVVTLFNMSSDITFNMMKGMFDESLGLMNQADIIYKKQSNVYEKPSRNQNLAEGRFNQSMTFDKRYNPNMQKMTIGNLNQSMTNPLEQSL